MLPGFIPRLQAELVRAINASAPTSTRPPSRPGRPRPAPYDRYAPLRPLLPYFAILNNPSPPPPTSGSAVTNAGRAPAFTPATMAWVGGSLAGFVRTTSPRIALLTDHTCCRALKTGGVEVPRERWDEEDVPPEDEDDAMQGIADTARSPRSILPDWTRTPLPVGAPPAPRPQPAPTIVTPQTEVGA